MRETQPSVYLIARPLINFVAIENYLRSVGGTKWLERISDDFMAKWFKGYDTSESEPISSAEILIEFAGRLCYKSWDVGLNPNVTKVRTDSKEYLGNILKSKHGSVLEHANFTFLFADVSRVFTHELVRHRAGVAISQESLRYVRLTDIGFRIPDVLEPVRASVVNIVEQIEELNKFAAKRFELDEEGIPFHVKKEVTSALRRIAPMGLSTSILFTANIRTLRHVIDMRTAFGAEEEIRFVFHKVGDVIKEECPYLFQDMYAEYDDKNSNQIPHWKFENEKV